MGKRSKRTEVVQPDDPSIRYIPLTNGYVAVVDARDYAYLAQWKWQAEVRNRVVYAGTSQIIPEYGPSKKHWLMHRLIMGISDRNVKIDHEDVDGLNNRRSNLRLATSLQSAHNRRKYSGKHTSKYKGVCFRGVGKYKYWTASCMANGVRKTLIFNSEEDAARGYDAMAYQMHGKFALLNFAYADGEIPQMPTTRTTGKRGVKPGTTWKWAREKRKSSYYYGEEKHGPPVPLRA